MIRKPSPRELAEFVTEDQYGLPMVSSQPGVSPDAYNAGPEFDQGGPPAGDDQLTEMRQCAAVACRHNQAGRCVLDAIEINERGGCQQYEAGADGSAVDDASRYDETETDVTGGTITPYQQTQQGGHERHWQTGRWDPKGGGH